METLKTAPYQQSQQMALGDELILVMIKSGLVVLASVLEKVYRAGWKPGRKFTTKELVAVGIPVSRARRATAQMDGKDMDRRKHATVTNSFCRELSSFFLFQRERTELNKNSEDKRVEGRPPKVKVLPHPDSLARLFKVTVTRYTQIPDKAKISDWCAEAYAFLIDHDPGRHPRKKLCQPLGISPTTSRAYDKRARVIVTPNHKRTHLRNPNRLPITPELKGVWLETKEVIHDKRGRQIFRRFIATQAGYFRARQSATKHGGRIWMVKQLANDYRRKKV